MTGHPWYLVGAAELILIRRVGPADLTRPLHGQVRQAGRTRLKRKVPGWYPERRWSRRARQRWLPVHIGRWVSAGTERNPDAEWFWRRPPVVRGSGRGGSDRIDDHCQLYVAAELARQGIGDQDPQPVLELVLGELIGRRDQSGVLDQAKRPGQLQPGPLVRFDLHAG